MRQRKQAKETTWTKTGTPLQKIGTRCTATYDIRTVPCPLVPTSPALVPTILHKILVNDATAEVPCVNFDTDGVTFIIDNSATCILSNDRSLFIGPLKPADTCVQKQVASEHSSVR